MSTSDAQLEGALNVKKLPELLGRLHPIVQNSIQKNRKDKHISASKGIIPKFMVGAFVPVAREHFYANERLVFAGVVVDELSLQLTTVSMK